MHRPCPNCQERTISALVLLFGVRHKCRRCSATIGTHWVAAFLLSTFVAAGIAFFGLYLLSLKLGLLVTLGLWLGVSLAVALAAAHFAPLEVKHYWFEP